jgi:hypothetical protein
VRFAELSVVSLLHSAKIDGQALLTGTKGTAVFICAARIAHASKVEVLESLHAVITLGFRALTE